MPGEVICDECKASIEIPKLRRSVLMDLVYEFYWHCTECNHKHISYYTNDKIRRDIKRLGKLRDKYAKSKTEEESRMHLARINTNDKLIQADMNALKNKMTKTLT